MAKNLSPTALALKATLHFLLLALTLSCANTARILTEEDDAPPPVTQPEPETPNPIPTHVADVAPVTGPTVTTATNPTTSANVANVDPERPTLSFFIHDILGGSAPSGRVVTGIIASTQINGIPFSKPNGGVFPISGGVPLVSANQGIINNNLPFIAGLNGATTVINNGNTLPFVTAGQLPQGPSLRKLMFGTITVIDDELTEGHELGSPVIGKAQGFYLASSLDGSSQTMALTTLFHNGDHHDDQEDAISFFGVHRTAAHESLVAIVGGTGKYENAKGYATIGTLHLTDQHTTDGVDTILQFNVYLTY